jgi:thymidylate kinase
MSGRIIYYDGADFAGKTTSCQIERAKLVELEVPIAMVHFPIRNLANDVEMINTELSSDIFQLCGKFHSKNITEIQDVIAENIEANSHVILRLYNEGFSIIIDRFVYSNIIYRKLYCPAELTLDEFYKRYPTSARVMAIADCRILSPDIAELIRRKRLRYSDSTPEYGSIDELNEEDENINRANMEFCKFQC